MINSDSNNSGADPASTLPDIVVSSKPTIDQDKSATENKRKDHPQPVQAQNAKKINKAQSCVDRKNHFLKNSRNNSTKSEESKKNARNYEASQNPNPGSSEPRKPKKNVVLYCSYCGTGYQGMQANPNAKTIEGEIFTALCKAGAVSEQNSDDQKKVQMQRAARTDKGVHAAGQIVSLKMITEDPDVISKINSFLPDQIRIWGYSPVIRSFNPKTLCDSRIYEYLLPTYVFMPPDEEIINLVNTKTYAERQELYTFFKAKETANSDAEETGEQDDDIASKSSEGKKLAPADLADSYEATNKPEIIEKHSTIALSKRATFRLDAESLKQLKEGFAMFDDTAAEIKDTARYNQQDIRDEETHQHSQSSRAWLAPRAARLRLVQQANHVDAAQEQQRGAREINQDEVSSGKFNQWTELCDVFPEQYPFLNADGIIPESAYDILN
ncbi:tRNA pseudouridine synthase 1 [Smittium culicis]|uniref:tRNA pseudouridine synthase 1 n=1 Tax=Smittium culicis TaxID=133412 RepID=A0A1R1Y2R3_9FUNG|nr:tRNA pseudouridine synthase 1 [Smittium culicis]